jgi:hypothetical protein
MFLITNMFDLSFILSSSYYWIRIKFAGPLLVAVTNIKCYKNSLSIFTEEIT